ncbi:LysM peptidoglycan-binding domain-containing protein [Heyndrickxia sp. NPDC080065]|uniref:LysM peptidoglycan-binding domain-containing protein n=1 Tax=Heyndrickxia sp. NPDC080065 TaxID=3390568 RepID=UPI003CFD9EC4
MNIYVVRKGDQLRSISQRYGVNIKQIIAANQLSDPNVLVVGQALVIPSPGREYIIQPGDNLWAIAKSFGTSVQAIAGANQISDPSSINVGQVITIPIQYHTVHAGETLWSIAQRYGVNTTAIADMNYIINPSTLYVGQVLRIPEKLLPFKEVNAYITKLNESGAQEVHQLGRYLTYLCPFTYSIKEDGTLTELNESAVLNAAKTEHITPLMTVTNFVNQDFNSDLAASILRNAPTQDILINNLLTVMRTKGYIGINFDFEYIYPEDRENYNAFLEKVVTKFHPNGYFVSTALAPKISSDQKGILYEAHDYEAQGQIVDFIVLMTYEWGWAGGKPLAIAPINEVKKVLDYAVTVIPNYKILMGAPLYGRDWKIPWQEGTFAKTIRPQQAVLLASKYGANIEYNQTYQSPFFRYTDETGQQHEVWFEDARSVQAKFDVVNNYGLRGISYWVLGNPFPQNWLVQENNFKAYKLI